MSQQIIIAEQARIAALLTDDRVDELIVAQGQYQIGDIFLGTVENVLPGIDAAFIDIGESDKNGFIHVSDLGPLRLKKGTFGITELLEPKQKVLVQVIKEPTGSKGPRLTGNISIPGKYLILQPYGQGVNISRKINTETERSRLKALGVLIKPPSTGLLFRTEAENIKEELLIDDLENLIQQWENILKVSETSNVPNLIKRDDDFSLKILRDYIHSSTKSIIIDSRFSVERAKDFLKNYESNINVEYHDNNLNQNILDELVNVTISANIKSTDIKNFFLASKLSDKKDFFNSLSLLFNIVGDKNLTQLNLIETYSVLTILKNLGFKDEYNQLASRILL